MPPRLSILQCLKAPNAASASCSRSFTSSSPAQASTVTQRRKHRDPYAIQQAKARKAANLSRQEVLKKERAAALGDPVRGIITPYVQSFDTAIPTESSAPATSTKTRISQSPDQDAPGPATRRDEHLNFFLHRSELSEGISHSQWLSTPPETSISAVTDALNANFSLQEDRPISRKEGEDRAAEAMRRIASLSLGSSKDRLRVNIQRCINDFGRHSTDDVLLPGLESVHSKAATLQEKTPRVGPDTGSSEVQIAILTAKIRTLADALEGRGRMDKVNKRNLRLLVHRRAKMLKYLRRKERGGPRFQNVVSTLGLTDGTWKGQISL